MLRKESCRSPRVTWIVAALVACFGVALDAHALRHASSFHEIEYAIYAPEWTWQARDINILAVLTNTGDDTRNVTLRLRLPQGQESHFGVSGKSVDWSKESLVREIEVPPGETRRQAFAGITALDGFPRQAYGFELVLESNGVEARVPYEVRTVRGQAIRGGWRSALGIPAGIALAWCAVFVWAMGRFAAPGAWKRSPESIPEPERQESWINETPK